MHKAQRPEPESILARAFPRGTTSSAFKPPMAFDGVLNLIFDHSNYIQ
jgi:hypothetical protein